MGWNNRLVSFKDNPCNGCTYETGRCVGCHSTCKEYIEAKKEHDKKIDKKKDEYNKQSDYIRYVTDTIAKSKKRKNQ